MYPFLETTESAGRDKAVTARGKKAIGRNGRPLVVSANPKQLVVH